MIDRYINLFNILAQKYSSFLFGPRGVGKSALAKKYAANIKEKSGAVLQIELLKGEFFNRYVSNSQQMRKDIIEQLIKAKENNQALTVIIDEIQKLPLLLDEVHSLLEEEEYKGRLNFLLTGSSARKLKKDGANLLAGRAWNLKLFPLSSLEVSLNLETTLQFGSLPIIYTQQTEPLNFLQAYVEVYLKEEIKQEGIVRKYESFHKFLELAAQLNGEPVNFSKTAKMVGVATNTLQDFYSILEDTLIAHRLDAWSYSVRQSLSQAPKYYFFDCGVLNGLRGELGSQLRSSTNRYGKLFETFIINEIISRNSYTKKNYKIYHWRTHQGQEIDLILSRNLSEPPIAIEIKSASEPDPSDLKPLRAFLEEYPMGRAIVLCTTPLPYKIFDDKVSVLNWQAGLDQILC